MITKVNERQIKVCVPKSGYCFHAVVRDGSITSLTRLDTLTVESLNTYIVFCHEVLRAINETTEQEEIN